MHIHNADNFSGIQMVRAVKSEDIPRMIRSVLYYILYFFNYILIF